jgi:hypothetical protein
VKFNAWKKHKLPVLETFYSWVLFPSAKKWFLPELPDFSWSKIPKRGKIYQITTKYMYQMAIKYFQWP